MINLIEPLLPRYEGKPDEKAKSINDLSYKRLKGLSQVIDNKRGSKFNERIDAILNKQLSKTAADLKDIKTDHKNMQQDKDSILIGCDANTPAEFKDDEIKKATRIAVFKALFSL